MAVTRRKFVQGSAVAGGSLAAANFLFGAPETVASTRTAPGSLAVQAEDYFPTTCWIGKQDCGMLARRVDGRVIKFDGIQNNPRNAGTLCPKGQAQIMAIYDPHRVKTPLIRVNAKGESGKWKEASWDEALELCATRINEVRAKDPELVVWQKGRSKAKGLYDEAFTKAIGCTKVSHGGYCSDAGYRALEYTLGPHGILNPDFRYTDYVLSWGWNITAAGGNKMCFITWPQEMVKAREERGTKIVQIDPRLRPAGPFADTWLPIRPATDLALALALCNVLIDEGYLDEPYLKRYTNAGSLVLDDGTIARAGESELVWDLAGGSAVPLAAALDPALEGTYEVDGQTVRPAFELFKQHVADSTPEWAAEICGVEAKTIREIGTTFGRKARIGATIVVDGVEVPHRPVGIMAYHMAQQELGFQALRAMTMVAMLVGAPGAAGGQMVDFKWEIHEHYEQYGDLKVKDPPYDFLLKDSKFFPINTGLPGMMAQVMNDPARFEVEKLPEAFIFHMVNPLGAFPSQPEFLEAYKKIPFAVYLSPWLNETADYFADVILPAATIEKYEGPSSADTQYVEAKSLRLPPMEPLFESRGEVDIYLDLTEAMGVLTGEEGYIAHVNDALELEDPYKLPTETKPTAKEIFNQWALSNELEGGIEYFERQGTWVKGPRKPTSMYGYVTTNEEGEPQPFGGALHRLYGESLLNAARQMEAKGAEEAWWRDYTALPTWRQPTFEEAPDDYDLTLISYKLVDQKQSRTSFIPLLAELSPEQRLDINPETARKKGIEHGEMVSVESQNPVTGDKRKLKVRASFTEGIRPDVVAMPHHFGLWTMPWSKGQGPSPNEIFYTGQGFVTNTADQSYHVKVRVFPEGSDS